MCMFVFVCFSNIVVSTGVVPSDSNSLAVIFIIALGLGLLDIVLIFGLPPVYNYWHLSKKKGQVYTPIQWRKLVSVLLFSSMLFLSVFSPACGTTYGRTILCMGQISPPAPNYACPEKYTLVSSVCVGTPSWHTAEVRHYRQMLITSTSPSVSRWHQCFSVTFWLPCFLLSLVFSCSSLVLALCTIL